MLLWALLVSGCLIRVAATGKCKPLPTPKWEKQYPEPPGGTRDVKIGSSGSQSTFYCEDGYHPYGRLSTIKNTPLFMEFIEEVPQYKCNPTTGVWTPETKLTDMTCAKPPTELSNSPLGLKGASPIYKLFNNSGAVLCNNGLQMRDPWDGEAIKDIKCKNSNWTVTFANRPAQTTPIVVIECFNPNATTIMTTILPPTTTAPTPIQCQLPKDVPATDFPSPWVNGGSMGDGKNNQLICLFGFIGKLAAGSTAFSFGGEYVCDKNTHKWIHPDSKYTAPDFLSCGRVDPAQPLVFCPINHNNTEGKVGAIALYPGDLEFCPPGEIPFFVENGRAITDMICSVHGLHFFTDDGVLHNPYHPTLQCVPANSTTTAAPTTTTPKPVCTKPAAITSTPPSPWEFEGPVRISADGRTLSCPSIILGQLGKGASVHTFGSEYYCNEKTLTWKYEGYDAPAFMSCGKNPKNLPANYCAVTNVQTSGSGGQIAIYRDKEQFCPTGQEVQYASGARIMSIACNDGVTIVDSKGNQARVENPKLRCAKATCPIPLKVSSIPEPFKYTGVPIINGDELSCSEYIIGQTGKDAHPHSFGNTFSCNETTNRWEANGYAAPPYMSCGIPNNVVPLNPCGVYNVQAETERETMLPIAIYPGKEQYCPIRQALMRYRGEKMITNITCSAGTISIDGDVWEETKSPVLKCV